MCHFTIHFVFALFFPVKLIILFEDFFPLHFNISIGFSLYLSV